MTNIELYEPEWDVNSAAWIGLCDHVSDIVAESRRRGRGISRPAALRVACQQHPDLARAAAGSPLKPEAAAWLNRFTLASAKGGAARSKRPAAMLARREASADPYKRLAEQRSRERGIGFHAAYQQVVAENPELYGQRVQTSR